ncbi:hypothetical protein ASD15_06425 [Massilia sp. Root351]|nr:hypothetical protein ASD15_06425 [Massilia sp. Root351]
MALLRGLGGQGANWGQRVPGGALDAPPPAVLPGLAAASGAAGRQPDLPAAGMVASWITSGDQSRLLQRQPDAPLAALPRALTPWSPGVVTAGRLPAPPRAIEIATGAAARRQQMAGFGAALSASSAWLLAERLDATQRRALLTELFGPAPGIALSVARLPLGAGEFARSQYSYNDLPAGQSDDGLAQFSIEPDRAYLVPLAQDALAHNPALELIASPYSAPGWMKTSGSLLQGALKPDAFDAYARYLKRYVDVYLEEGIAIHAITLQSDPAGGPSDAPAMRLDDAARAQLIGKHLGPLLEDEGPLILEWDGNRDTPQAPLKVLQDKVAGPYVAGVAWHCYAGSADAQGAVAAAHPGKSSYLTECSGGAWAPAWRDNLTHFGRTLVQAATRGAANGILFGNLALDEQGGPRIGGCRGCRGVVTVDEGGNVTRNPEYYALAHASRFVRPGAWRLDSVGGNLGQDGIDSAAFENRDGTLVLVAVNSGAEARTVTVRAAAQSYSASLPPASLATYVWRPQP